MRRDLAQLDLKLSRSLHLGNAGLQRARRAVFWAGHGRTCRALPGWQPQQQRRRPCFPVCCAPAGLVESVAETVVLPFHTAGDAFKRSTASLAANTLEQLREPLVRDCAATAVSVLAAVALVKAVDWLARRKRLEQVGACQ